MEIGRDGTVVFGRRNNLSAQNEISVHIIYEIWASALCLLKDLEAKWGISRLAVVQAGLQGINRGQTVSGTEQQGRFSKDEEMCDIRFNAIMLSEEWKPKEVLHEYARLLANAVHLEQPLKSPPWIE